MTNVETAPLLSGPKAQPLSRETGKLVELPSQVSNEEDVSPSSAFPEMEPAIRIVVADAETIFRDSLRVLLQGSDGFEVVGGCADCTSTLNMVRRVSPDVLLLDFRIPSCEALDVLRELRDSASDVKVILLCSTINKDDTVRALQMGARGIVLKTDPVDSLIECIHKVMGGEFWLGKEGLAKLVQALCDSGDAKNVQKNKYGLTPRESEIIVAVLDGYSNPEIAVNLSLSEQTVKHHLSHIFDKLGVYSRLELALFAVNHGISAE